MGPGSYVGIVTLKKPLDFESRSSYDMVIRATDNPADPTTVLSSTANILIQVTTMSNVRNFSRFNVLGTTLLVCFFIAKICRLN